jgi:hypothetical protein
MKCLNTNAVTLKTAGTAQYSCVIGKEIQMMTHSLVKEVTKNSKNRVIIRVIMRVGGSITISISFMCMQKNKLVVLPKILYSTEIKIMLMDGIKLCFRSAQMFQKTIS